MECTAWDHMGELNATADGSLEVQEWQCQAFCSRSRSRGKCFGHAFHMKCTLAVMADKRFLGLS